MTNERSFLKLTPGVFQSHCRWRWTSARGSWSSPRAPSGHPGWKNFFLRHWRSG